MGYANKPELAVVGIETSKLHLKAVLLRDGALLCKVLENDMAGYRWLRSWLQKNEVDVAGLRVCLRLDAPHSDITARSLALMGMQVCDAPPAALAQFARDHGLDVQGMGAVLLAHYAAAAQPPRWTPPPPAYMELRLWLQRLQAVQAVRRQEATRLDGHLQAGQQALHALLQQQIACLDQQIAEHEEVILAHLRRHPNLDQPPELAGQHQRVARLAFPAEKATRL
ncbi:hypothetical protein [Janthinobacterium psychrotolerans]|uniref:Transposase n=1 Tax=Janthinobacterium psychrotolerans TaxID=1747903 RepID=A0A1A7BVM3_9BURK|nr:hypothetical protein [Janthinobacterium psychrotolerans]OBV37611.1 Transposase [Janthinobacterium psychrotolerans]